MRYLSPEGQSRFKDLLKKDYERAVAERRVIEVMATCDRIPSEIGTFHPVESVTVADITRKADSAFASGVLTVTYGSSEQFDNPCVLLMYNHEGVLCLEMFELTVGALILWFEGRRGYFPLDPNEDISE